MTEQKASVNQTLRSLQQRVASNSAIALPSLQLEAQLDQLLFDPEPVEKIFRALLDCVPLFIKPGSLIVRTGIVGSPIQRHLGTASDGSFLTILMSEKSLPIGCIDHTPEGEFTEISGMKRLATIVGELSGTVLVTDAGGRLRRIRCIVPMPNEQRSGEKHGRETILLVEDEEFVRNVTREVLELSGYNVLEAIDAEMGIKIFREEANHIDLLLTDVVMPGMNGHDLALKLFETSPMLRVIFMSGYTENAITRQGLSDPRLVYLQKPFTLDVLTKKVREVLDSAALVDGELGFLPAAGTQSTQGHV